MNHNRLAFSAHRSVLFSKCLVAIVFFIAISFLLPVLQQSHADTAVDDQLLKIKDLYERGLITESDYDAQKKKILDQYTSSLNAAEPKEVEVLVSWKYAKTSNIITTFRRELRIGGETAYIPQEKTLGRMARGSTKIYVRPGKHYMSMVYYSRRGRISRTEDIGDIEIMVDQPCEIVYEIDSGKSIFSSDRGEYIYVNDMKIHEWSE